MKRRQYFLQKKLCSLPYSTIVDRTIKQKKEHVAPLTTWEQKKAYEASRRDRILPVGHKNLSLSWRSLQPETNSFAKPPAQSSTSRKENNSAGKAILSQNTSLSYVNPSKDNYYSIRGLDPILDHPTVIHGLEPYVLPEHCCNMHWSNLQKQILNRLTRYSSYKGAREQHLPTKNTHDQAKKDSHLNQPRQQKPRCDQFST